MLTDISFASMSSKQRGTFMKLALRRAQAISVVNVAVVLSLEKHTVTRAAIALGAVAPKIIRAPAAEEYLKARASMSQRSSTLRLDPRREPPDR